MHKHLNPLRALAHPLWVGALVLMVVNDHLLKDSGVLPELIYGKLSDVAGLLVAPALLAALLRLRTRRAVAWAHLATGAVFAAINLSVPAAVLFGGLTALTPLPWHITVDPWDVLALPALLVSWRALVPAMAKPAALRPWPGRAAAAVGLLACMGTSPPEIPAQYWTSFVIANNTDQERVIRVRPLKPSVQLDCAQVESNPSLWLSRPQFDRAVVWKVKPGEVIPVGEDDGARADCLAFLVDGGDLDPVLFFWQRDTYPPVSSSTEAEKAPPGRTIALSDADGELDLGNSAGGAPFLFAPPPPFEIPPGEGCAAESAGGITWSTPVPVGSVTVLDVTVAPDGCAALDLHSPVGVARWYVCAPPGALIFEPDDVLSVSRLTRGQRGDELDGVEIRAQDKLLRLGRGADVVPVPSIQSAALNGPVEGCGVFHGRCGALVEPVAVVLDGEVRLRSGQAADLEGGVLHIARAERAAAVDTQCEEAGARPGLLIESAWVQSAGASSDDPEGGR